MARIRTIKPEFWTSEQVAECSTTARLLFIGLWNFCDDGGVHPASSKRIKMEIFPADNFSEEQISGFVNELISAGLLVKYSSEGKSYLGVTGWSHQKIDKPSLKYPQREFDDRSTNGSGTFDDRSPPEGKGREGKGCIGDVSASTPTEKKQTQPTVDEVREYCTERGKGIDPEQFHDFYTANGWKQGRSGKPIKDWRAAVRTWERNEFNRGSPAEVSRVPTDEDLKNWTPD